MFELQNLALDGATVDAWPVLIDDVLLPLKNRAGENPTVRTALAAATRYLSHIHAIPLGVHLIHARFYISVDSDASKEGVRMPR